MEHKEFWTQILFRLKPTIRKQHFLTWFNNTIILNKTVNKIVVGLPSSFFEMWVKDKYGVKVLQAAKEIDPAIEVVEYAVSPRLADKGNTDGVDVKKLYSEEEKKVRKVRNENEVDISVGKTGEKIQSKFLNDRYTLNTFVVGKENRLPHAACQAVGNMPGGIYNPLYIYGGVGLGKTHLVQAIGHEILKNYPDKVVKYVTAERFVTEIIDSILKKNMMNFKEKYRHVDCLLIDDVQFFAKKDSSQQELFHTFNELYENNKQVVITSDRSPSELDGLDDRLKSRFGMGMVVELLMPGFETRVAILQEKCKEQGVLIDPDVLNFIANNVATNVRELESILKQLNAECQLYDKSPTISTVAEILKRMNKAHKIIGLDVEQKRKNVFLMRSPNDIVDVVSQYYKIPSEQIFGLDRHKEIMEPRQVCMYLIKKELGQSYERIGVDFSHRNHTTVINAVNRIEKQLKKDLHLIRDLNAIRQEMGFSF
ncbi:MAG: chromosomal replication initiator protein DnaA [Candidatus Gracilibacteria bacterium]|jgi:chromosomal replication initiator protein